MPPSTLRDPSISMEDVSKTADIELAQLPQLDPTTFAIGIGYPDIRLRLKLGYSTNIDGKFTFNDGIQIYSIRLSWNFLDIGPIKAIVGGEAGWAKFDGVDSMSGVGTFAQGLVGLEYPFAKRFRISVDIGPAWINVYSDGYTYSTAVAVYNTALYYYLF